MTDRPIIFSAPMVRALLDGRKTMTRRLAWRRHDSDEWRPGSARRGWRRPFPRAHYWESPSPWQRVQPGDRLWVREAWAPDFDGAVLWRESRWGSEPFSPEDKPVKWRPSIHMPRWASRLTLIVTATKIERLHSMSTADERAEGFDIATMDFCKLWDALHGPGAYDANPEVVALTFRVVRANIDSAEARAT